jgi:hypothetical protein
MVSLEAAHAPSGHTLLVEIVVVAIRQKSARGFDRDRTSRVNDDLPFELVSRRRG